MEDVNLNLKSETVDKAIDTFGKPLYDDVAKPAIQTSKNALGFCSQFIVSGIKPFMYSKIKECEYKIKEIDKRLEKKYNHILDENKTEPRTNILGPAVDVLKYNLEEEHIKEMFINLISNDMDKSKRSKVLPSYIEIVKQLSKDDANFLKLLNERKLIKDLPIIRLILADKDSHFFDYLSTYFICLADGQTIEVPPIILDNLIRLRIVEIPSDEYFANTTIYDQVFENLKNSLEFSMFNNISNKYLDNEKGKMKLTDYGKNFIDICLS